MFTLTPAILREVADKLRLAGGDSDGCLVYSCTVIETLYGPAAALALQNLYCVSGMNDFSGCFGCEADEAHTGTFSRYASEIRFTHLNFLAEYLEGEKG